MWLTEDDIPGDLVVFDMEWIGDSSVPGTTHVTQIAAQCVASGELFATRVRPLAKGPISCAPGPREALQDFIRWLPEKAVLIAHNGIRFDAPVLAANMRRCGINVPEHMVMLDSLFHLRHHLKHRSESVQYDLDSLCASLDIVVDAASRHEAAYDVHLLHRVLSGMRDRWGVPYISGMPQPVGEISPALVHGIGPTVCSRIGTCCLLTLCDRILQSRGSLDEDCVYDYLLSLDLRSVLPTIDLRLIAQHVGPTARRHFNYLEAR